MRKGMAQGLSRPAYFDRNPLVKWITAATANAAPHGTTTRATYTVPAGRKAQVELMFLGINRTAAAAPVGVANNQIQYTPSGGTAAIAIQSFMQLNAVGDSSFVNGGRMDFIAAGDQLALQDGDASTGGTVTFQQSLKATEYDA